MKSPLKQPNRLRTARIRKRHARPQTSFISFPDDPSPIAPALDPRQTMPF